MLTIRRCLGVLAIAIGAVALGALINAANACEGGRCPDDDPAPVTSGQTVTVQVTGTFVGGGSEGSSGSSGSTTVQVAPPCIYFQGMTGKEYYEYWHPNGQEEPRPGMGMGNHEVEKPYDGYKEHKDDTEGNWYFRMCSSANFDGDIAAFFDYAQEWFDSHGPVFVPPGGSPPIPPIPPEILLQAAEESMTVPDPVFDWNPRRAADQGTLVNLPTWFWLDPDTPTSGSVTASAGPSSVTVDLALTNVEYHADTAGSVVCDDGGTPWSPGASSDCTLTFGRAGADEVSASTRWDGTWSYNGAPQGALDPIGASWSTDLVVSEVQSVVTGVG
jgi:hypothetical protein